MDQKGSSLIVIIVIIVVIIIGAIALLATVVVNIPKNLQQSSSTIKQSSNVQQSKTTSQSIPGLDKVDMSSYIFYYPTGYVKLEKKRGDATVLYYALESKKDASEGIGLAMYPVNTRMDTPSTEFCMEFLQFFLRSNKNVRIVEAKPVDFIKSHGCDLRYVDDSVPNKLAVHEKQLWYKEGDDLNGYGVKASYLLTSSQSEKDTLDLAVNNFILK